MPRVLVLCEFASLNGGERSLLAAADGVRSHGFELLVAAPPTGPLADQLAERRIPLVPLRLHDSSGNRLPPAACRNRIRDAIAGCRTSLVHANSLAMSRLSGPVVRRMGLPGIGHLRDIIRLTPAAIADLNCHTRLLAVSHATRDWYIATGLNARKTHVLYNGVDLQRFQPRPATGRLHRELGLPAGAPIVGAIGQIGMRKGLHVLIDAARCIVQAVPGVHFVAVGKRYSKKQEAVEYEAALVRRTSAPPLKGRFHWLGVREDVPALLNEFTVLAHAARQEPLGRVLLEAAAAAVPIAATDVGGTREIFPEDLGAARLVPPNDPAALSQVIVELLRDPGLRARLGSCARRRAEQMFSVRRAAVLLAEHYRQGLDAGVISSAQRRIRPAGGG